jgi:hypothetical protein
MFDPFAEVASFSSGEGATVYAVCAVSRAVRFVCSAQSGVRLEALPFTLTGTLIPGAEVTIVALVCDAL